MAATQTQIRRDSNTNLLAATPADGELGYDQTNKRLIIGDGSTAGGLPTPSHVDLQNQIFTAGTTTGTDTVVLTLPTHGAPAAYATRQRFAFIAGGTNTTTATLNVNALGAKTIKKVQAGAKANLVAGDITSGRPYDVMYDGTDFVLMGGSGGVVDGAITNAKLADAAAGDYIVAEAFAETSNATSYTKLAEIKAPRDGTYRVRVRVLNDGTSGTAYAKAYVNGTTAGTEVSIGDGLGPAWQNDDIPVNAGDLVQLYAYRSGSSAEVTGGRDNGTAIALCESSPIEGGVLYTLEGFW